MPLWTPAALPWVVTIMEVPANTGVPRGSTDPIRIGSLVAENGPDRIIEIDHQLFRIHDLGAPDTTASKAVVVPIDALIEIRAAAMLRLFRGLTGRRLGPDSATLSRPRRARLVLALRALDGRLQDASYRDIAEALFGAERIPRRGWKTHDLRDRVIRLVRDGFEMMRGGYRHLLLYPFRRKR